jgi:hypothetical protein
MSEYQTNHHRIVKEAVEGKRSVDEQTHVSLAILDERLQRLRKLDKIFDEVQFSSAVRKILTQKDTCTVC